MSGDDSSPARRLDERDRRGQQEVERLRQALVGIGYAPERHSAANEDLDPETSDRIWRKIQDARARDELTAPRGARPARRQLTIALALAAAVALLTSILVLQPGSVPRAVAQTPPLLSFSVIDEGQTGSTDQASATAQLDALATTALAHPLPPTSGQPYLIRRADWSLASDRNATSTRAAVIPYTTTTRVGADGSLDRVEHLGRALTTDGRGLRPGGDPLHQPTRQHDTFPPGSVDTGLMQRLPRDPGALRSELLREQGCTSTTAGEGQCLLQAITGFYTEQQVPSDLQAAFWQMLAEEPHLGYLGIGRDRAGRPCIGIELLTGTRPTKRWVLLIDPTTGHYLGDEQVLLTGTTDGVTAPAVLNFTTLLTQS